ncbi:MAG TPA: serine/threonine-protein kinase, partial [Xanthomonadaceae bacterium]|nr:serine/threonine-protein kinase [Xanthomonadaceae bacterium]
MQQPATPADPRLVAVPDTEDAPEFPNIPGYRFQKRLGQGGMATVYLATQESLDRPVSIKVMEREALQDETSMQRFENEARTIAKLSHPGIVNIYEVGRTADARMYYIMPYLANGDLAQRDLRHNEARIVEVLRTLLSALGYAHARGIVHRDVKEENVLFDAADRPLLTDFGIALSKRDTSRITTAGLAVGSSGYMAPEQARGDVVDGRADLYSVGVMAYELLTGKLPYRSPDPLTLALMHAQNPIPRLPPEKRHWQSFIDRAMAKSPSQRYRDAQQMLHALDRVDRRTGNHISGRLLRRYDDTVHGRIWKRPGTIALGGVLLIAFGLYSARDQ